MSNHFWFYLDWFDVSAHVAISGSYLMTSNTLERSSNDATKMLDRDCLYSQSLVILCELIDIFCYCCHIRKTIHDIKYTRTIIKRCNEKLARDCLYSQSLVIFYVNWLTFFAPIAILGSWLMTSNVLERSSSDAAKKLDEDSPYSQSLVILFGFIHNSLHLLPF